MLQSVEYGEAEEELAILYSLGEEGPTSREQPPFSHSPDAGSAADLA